MEKYFKEWHFSILLLTWFVSKSEEWYNPGWEVLVSSELCISSVIWSGRRSFWVYNRVAGFCLQNGCYSSVLTLRICWFCLSLFTGSLKNVSKKTIAGQKCDIFSLFTSQCTYVLSAAFNSINLQYTFCFPRIHPSFHGPSEV